MENEFWRGKRVLVTGADGFMGSHLCERLLELGARVSAFVRYVAHSITGQQRLRNLAHEEHRLAEVIRGDLGCQGTVRLIRNSAPQVILHLGADAYVPHSFENPVEVVQANVQGTLNVLEACRDLQVERCVVTSSSEVYGPCEGPIDEQHVLRPTSPYAASKVAADRLAYAYAQTFHLPIAIIRPFNTYGPRHTYDVVPKFIRLALDGEPLTIYGDGSQTRDLSYVSDMIEAFLTMGSHPRAAGETVNFGTGREISILELAQLILRLSGSGKGIVHQPVRAAEVRRLVANASHATALLGWKPRVALEEGLARNLEWARTAFGLGGARS